MSKLSEQIERMAPRPTTPTDAERTIAAQFAALGWTCTTIAEAAQAMEDLSTLARTEAAAKAGALVELGVLRGLIREVVNAEEVPYFVGHTTHASVVVSRDLWDRLVTAARTTEGR